MASRFDGAFNSKSRTKKRKNSENVIYEDEFQEKGLICKEREQVEALKQVSADDEKTGTLKSSKQIKFHNFHDFDELCVLSSSI